MLLKRRLFTLNAAATLTAPLLSRCSPPSYDFHSGRTGYPEEALPDGDLHIPLWNGAPPDGGGPQGEPRLSPRGALTNIATPTLSVHRPEHPNGAAVIVAGGGGYRYIQIRKEGVLPARWLTSLGITAFVLLYRLPGEHWKDGRMAPFQDAQRAIRLVRGHAKTFGIDPSRIGALGFSAGGHLMGTCAIRPKWQTYRPVDMYDSVPTTLALSLLAYPVVTLEPPYQRTGTRRMLIGDHPTEQASIDWSMQTYVKPGDPPFFLVQAADDRIASAENTAILEKACKNNDVDVVRYLFRDGGHGFGMGRPGTQTTIWPELAREWMRQRHFIS
ncbi:alpha/beta hydrolase [Acetobacter sicerae]|uniref:alpha/beta hydrolase n=1 Tax=Acetobacter sicerae TaxID=85325 RepID=UPI00156B66E5|nr:alpha/beta hydrolase [Acetobacter sicerae]NHN91861.1 alpha/beta hydrolase fold domain-containing protein [Acetobacter sicerae]